MGGPEHDYSSDDDVFSDDTTNNNQLENYNKTPQPRFGILFDIDGVIARGSNCLDASKEMIKKLCIDGDLKVPITFVTNGCNRDKDKANILSQWLGVPVSVDQMMHAQSPLKVFKSYHHKYVLILGQGPIELIAKDLGFTNFCTIEDVKESYPLLDMVDHANRRAVAKGHHPDNPLPQIEAIVMFGEPVRWESNLQLLIDLLVTNGNPTKAPEEFPREHIPILACNMDLVFMAEACMPRFGHGAFLVCLEALYKKITGHEMRYTALIGKPSEITYRYAEHCIAQEAKRLGIVDTIVRMYLIGDNPEVDIVGANLYDKYISRFRRRSDEMIANEGFVDYHRLRNEIAISKSRAIPSEAEFSEQTVRRMEGILVSTGVYKPTNGQQNVRGAMSHKNHQGHRDFENRPELRKPTHYANTVLDAVEWILEKEKFSLT